jgi:hypothetical protein
MRRSIVPILSVLLVTAVLAVGAGSTTLTEAATPLSFATPTPTPHPLFKDRWEYSDKPLQISTDTRSTSPAT